MKILLSVSVSYIHSRGFQHILIYLVNFNTSHLLIHVHFEDFLDEPVALQKRVATFAHRMCRLMLGVYLAPAFLNSDYIISFCR